MNVKYISNNFKRRIFKREKNIRVVFTHIPKCGGTSIDSAMRKLVGKVGQPRIEPVLLRRAFHLAASDRDDYDFVEDSIEAYQFILSYHLSLQWQYISGHLPTKQKILSAFPQYSFVTMLRNPVDRWKSHYLYNKVSNDDPHVPPVKSETDVEREFETIVGADIGTQMGSLMTMMLSGKFVSGNRAHVAVSEAVSNLSHYKVVGFLDRMDQFVEDIESLTGKRLNVGELNTTQSRAKLIDDKLYSKVKEMLKSKGCTRKIEELCAPDIELYEQAVAKYRV
jgi:hypothetical protein